MSDHASAHKPADAEQLTKQRHVQDGIATKPKRSYGPPSGPTGDDYVDRGAICDETMGPGCLLTHDRRSRLISKFAGRVLQAASNFNDALQNVQLEVMLEKAEDLSWAALLLLDLATWHVGSMVTTALTTLKTGQAEKLQKIAGTPATLDRRLREAFVSVSDTRIRESVKKSVDATKRGLTAAARRPRSQATKAEKAESLSFLAELRSAANLGFQQIRERVPATMNDAEMITLVDAFDVGNHKVDAYQQGIEDKLARYRSSGVAKIGSRYEHRLATEQNAASGDVIRDVRVVWLEFESSYPRKLAFQHQDGRIDYGVMRRDDPGSPLPTRRDFGPHDAVTSDPEMGHSEISGTNFFVPDEFVEAALARHEEMWGAAPTTVHVDDSNWHWEPARAKAAAEHKRHKAQVAHTNPAARAPAAPSAPAPPPAPIVIPDELKLRPPGAP